MQTAASHIARHSSLIPVQSTDAHRFCHACSLRQERRSAFLGTEHLCGHPAACDPVTGRALVRCDDMRSRAGACGPMARLYQEQRSVTPEPVEVTGVLAMCRRLGAAVAEARAAS